MRWRWPPWRRAELEVDESAARARRESERRLVEAERRWPEVRRARNVFEEQVRQALRGQR